MWIRSRVFQIGTTFKLYPWTSWIKESVKGEQLHENSSCRFASHQTTNEKEAHLLYALFFQALNLNFQQPLTSLICWYTALLFVSLYTFSGIDNYCMCFICCINVCKVDKRILERLLMKYSQTSLIRTSKGQNQVFALKRCPYYKGREHMIFGISVHKREVSIREVRL